jgi:hypothetical protein
MNDISQVFHEGLAKVYQDEAKKTPSSQMTPNFVREERKAKKSTNSDEKRSMLAAPFSKDLSLILSPLVRRKPKDMVAKGPLIPWIKPKAEGVETFLDTKYRKTRGKETI